MPPGFRLWKFAVSARGRRECFESTRAEGGEREERGAEVMGYASCRTLLAFPCLLAILRTPDAFVAPGGVGALRNPNRVRSRSRPPDRRLPHELSRPCPPRAQAAGGQAAAANGGVESAEEEAQGPAAYDGKLSGKEAVEQAAERLIPLFAQVDAHTQR